ncbi:MAG TPA: caspase family protein [Burkholderiaceae bacterium]|nr:caspase family protein [Burkholderiaceae bacterium]
MSIPKLLIAPPLFAAVFSFFCFFSPLAGAQAMAEHRLALVIGNASYRNSPLVNPVNDARLMEAALREAGFDVIKAENASLRDMRRLLRDFGDRLKQRGGVGLFYFAGHGLQVRGENYLVSVDSDIRNEDEVADDALNAQLVLEKMQSAGNRVNVVILDACRNNPFAVRSRSAVLGLATMHAPSGSIIAYSTAPGSVASDGGGQNGLYTQHLARVIPQAGVPIEEAFKMVRAAVRRESNNQQVPWENTALEGQFYFKPAAGEVVAALGRPDSLPPPVVLGPSSREIAYWENVKNSGSVQELQSYLERFPNGEFAAIARSRIASMPKSQGMDSAALTARPAPAIAQATAPIPIPIPTVAPAAGSADAAAVASAAPVQDREIVAGTTRFIGKFVQDAGGKTWSGSGKVLWANGDQFEGTLEKGKREGTGRFSWSNGQYYEGAWLDDRPNGSGTLRFPDGNQFEGTVVNGQPEGQGRMRYASEDTYVGQLSQGLPHGRGVYTWKSGQRFDGDWQKGAPQGSGNMQFANGNQYQGGIANGIPHGAGRMVYASGDTYTGNFSVGVPDGNGVFAWKNGDQYSGQWKSGNKDGQGVFVWGNGDRWEGVFSNDRQTEQGTLTRKSP